MSLVGISYPRANTRIAVIAAPAEETYEDVHGAAYLPVNR